MSILFIQEVPGWKFKIKYSSFRIKILNLSYLLHLPLFDNFREKKSVEATGIF
jgi:hypothetical protein